MLVDEMEEKSRTCILYISHGHHIAGVSNLFDLLPDKFKLSTLQDASQEDITSISDTLSKIPENCPPFTTFTALSLHDSELKLDLNRCTKAVEKLQLDKYLTK